MWKSLRFCGFFSTKIKKVCYNGNCKHSIINKLPRNFILGFDLTIKMASWDVRCQVEFGMIIGCLHPRGAIFVIEGARSEPLGKSGE